MFFATSLAQIYPELARLADHGLLTRREDPHGARQRSAYSITDTGEDALREWLRSERFAPPQFHNETFLRIFFADVLVREEQAALMRRIRDRCRDTENWMRATIFPLAEPLAAAGLRNPYAVARLGADLYGFVADWLEDYAIELEHEST